MRCAVRCGLVVLGCMVGCVAGAGTITPSPYWKDQISFPSDPFVQGAFYPQPAWVKFTILTDDTDTVYFQDSRQYLFHYDFATAELDPYVGLGSLAYDQVTLYAAGQEAILGSVILPPADGNQAPEFGIQFVRQDPYTAQEIVDLFNTVKGAVTAAPNVTAYYFPTFEQTAVAEANREFLETNGVVIGSPARWSKGNPVYAPGWALGRLTYVAGEDIEDAYLDGTLLPTDILLTDGVPAEVPFVAGILSLSASTPNSHVAILANTYGVPFAFLANASDAAGAQELVGHRVAVRAENTYFGSDVRVIDTDGEMSPEQVAEVLALKTPPELDIVPMATYGAYSASTDGLGPADIQYFGGKASNYGLLRSAIPTNARVACAFSFDLWNDFLDQTVTGGGTLRAFIAAQLSGYTYPPADMAALSDTLDDIRDFIEDETVFSPALAAAVIATLQDNAYGFDPNSKIRFRSSTNVEDSAAFTGAGLYDSKSGCLADDLDGDDVGPSICDGEEEKERGVFRAIRKVFASFYNDNAYLERLRYGIDETKVGMAVLVHHSYPDPLELANGVATYTKGGGYPQVNLVTQDGAVSVANPDVGVIPEEVSASVGPTRTYLYFDQGSSLVPLGAKVMDWEEDYLDFVDLFKTSAEEFSMVTGKSTYTLDFEYKKLAPDGHLAVKQVREIPATSGAALDAPFLVNEPVAYQVFQGEAADVFANHRLKATFQFQTDTRWLDEPGVSRSFYEEAEMTYAADGSVHVLEGAPSAWPGAGYAYDSGTAQDTWQLAALDNPRTYTLSTSVPEAGSLTSGPLLTLLDLGESFSGHLLLNVVHDRCVPTIDYLGPTTTTEEVVVLAPPFEPQPGDLLQERTSTTPGDVTIETSFYWPPDPGAAAGYTAPLSRWVETTITGYTTSPIVLTGYYAQTYRPEHHNFSEHFLFEPQLEAGISSQQLDELAAKDIRLIYWHAGYTEEVIRTYGFGDVPGCEAHEGEGEGEATMHSADTNGDEVISLSEVLRVIQLHNVGSHSCFTGEGESEDGYVLGSGDTGCVPHASDYNPQDWSVALTELLRAIQFYNLGGYTACPGVGEDGFCPNPT